MPASKPNTSHGFHKTISVTLAAVMAVVTGVIGNLHSEELPETIVGVRIEGNETIPTSAILQKIVTQPKRAITNRQIREDKRT